MSIWSEPAAARERLRAATLKPYYEDALVTLYHGDARDLLPLMRADLILTDPPYANGTEYASYHDDEAGLRELIAALFPLVTERALITPGVANMHLYPRPRWTLAWVTPAGAGSGPWGFSCWQPVLAYGSDPYLAAGKGRKPDMLIRTETSEPSPHPCAKPIDVWRWLLMRGSLDARDVVLDPFAGAGTTLRAAKDCGRRAVGIELEERYCEAAASRLCQEVLPLTFSLDPASLTP